MGNSTAFLRCGLFPLFAGLSQLVAVGHTSAAILNYTETATGSGKLNGTPFTNAVFTISTTADTTSVTTPLPGIYAIVNPTTYFTLTGASPTPFTDIVQVVSNTTSNGTNPGAGFGDNTQDLAILFDDNSIFVSYNLQTPIGPVTGTPANNPLGTFQTAVGPLVINSVLSVSFQATAVPEPTLIGLIALGGGFLTRRKRA